MRHDYIRNPNEDVVIELHINEKRYRKVYSPPFFTMDYRKTIGDMQEIQSIRYLHVPSPIDNATLLNDIVSLSLHPVLSKQDQERIQQVADDIDGIPGNLDAPLFDVQYRVRLHLPDPPTFSPADYQRIFAHLDWSDLVLGIDNVEATFDWQTLDDITTHVGQTIYATNDKTIVQHHDYYVSALYKGEQQDDFDTIKKRLDERDHKTYVLVEGKYDVNWFETALRLLGKDRTHTVIPCGGIGNITFVRNQLEKEGYPTVVITDGDGGGPHALRRDVIELYADVQTVNRLFHTNFRSMPKRKESLFRAIHEKDDVVKNLLSRWAKKHLTKDHPFVQEVAAHLARA
jgi:hypothetical protein